MPGTPNDKLEAVRLLVQEMAGQRLPSERQLSERFNISRPQLRAILAQLEKSQLVHRRRGSGTYAVRAIARVPKRISVLVDGRLKLGDDPLFSGVVEHLRNALESHDMRCVIARINETAPLSEIEDAVITLGHAGSRVIEVLGPDDPPAVGLFIEAVVRPLARVSLFTLADRDAGKQAALRLIEIGCKEIIYIGRSDLASAEARLEGARSAAAEAGAPLSLVEAHLNYSAGLYAGRELLLPTGESPVGIIAFNDWLAVGLRAGMAANPDPRVVSAPMVSFDGLKMASDPALHIQSLAIPMETIAADACSELLRLSGVEPAVGRTIVYPLSWLKPA